MDIAVVGAGFAGLATAKHLRSFGHHVTVFEKSPDVGGVWSATRRYPGMSTQSPKDTYVLSDWPMPKSFPDRPSGAHVQAYLESYVNQFDLAGSIRLNTEVVAATSMESGWALSTRATDANGKALRDSPTSAYVFQHLVVCNGTFSEPSVPKLEGGATFEAAGGIICHTSDIPSLDVLRDKNVVVVGYGKSACDVACSVSNVSKSTTVVARNLLWKMPERIGGLLDYKHLMLTRIGESLFKYMNNPTGLEQFMHSPGGLPIRNTMVDSLRFVIQRQLGLPQIDLTPPTKFETIACSSISLVTGGFYEKVRGGEITVKRDSVISELVTAPNGSLSARLNGGTTSIPADVIICGTGFQQPVSFLPAEVLARCTDAHGNWLLYRNIQPAAVPNLSFVGYSATLFNALTSELSALWVASNLEGWIGLPSDKARLKAAEDRLAFLERYTSHHAHGTSLIPFSMHVVDELLADMDVQIPRMTLLKEYLSLVDPSVYTSVSRELLRRKAEGNLSRKYL